MYEVYPWPDFNPPSKLPMRLHSTRADRDKRWTEIGYCTVVTTKLLRCLLVSSLWPAWLPPAVVGATPAGVYPSLAQPRWTRGSYIHTWPYIVTGRTSHQYSTTDTFAPTCSRFAACAHFRLDLRGHRQIPRPAAYRHDGGRDVLREKVCTGP